MTAFEEAKDWYVNRATNMDRAGVKIRMTKCYLAHGEKEAFVLCVADEQARKPLP